MFVTFDDATRKNGFKILSSWKQFFLKTFVSIDFLGPKEFILSIAQ